MLEFTLEDPTNFIYASTVAKATSFGIGAKYFVNEDVTLGINLKNLDSQLTTVVETTDDNGNVVKSYDVSVPYDYSAGLDWKYSEDINLAMDYQIVFGDYGSYDIDFQLLRFGTTIRTQILEYHLGVIAPIKLESSKLDSIELPFPVLPTLGLGWHNEFVDLSLAFYIHPIMSLHIQEPSPSLDVSMSYYF